MKKIGIVGSRRRDSYWDYVKILNNFFKIYEEGDIIISGGCPLGADKIAESIAQINSIPIKIHKAEWKKLGKIAGFMRNTEIAKESDVLIACVAKDRTGGTEDTVKKFKKYHPNGKIFLC